MPNHLTPTICTTADPCRACRCNAILHHFQALGWTHDAVVSVMMLCTDEIMKAAQTTIETVEAIREMHKEVAHD